MPLPLPREAKKVSTTYLLPEDGIYKVVLKTYEDKIDEFPDTAERVNKRKGNSFYNFRFEFENGRSRFERVDYLNKEGYKEPNGYNFILAMREVLFNAEEVPSKLKEVLKNKELNSDEIFAEIKKYEVPFYVAYRNTKANNGETYTNINNFIDPFYELTDEIEEIMTKKKIKFVMLEKATSDSSEYNEDNSNDQNDSQEDDY